MTLKATSRIVAVSIWGSIAVFLASAETACLIAAPASSCGWGWPGRTHSPRSGCVHVLVTAAGSWRASSLVMPSA